MYQNFQVNKNDDSTVNIEGELAPEELEKHRTGALKEIGNSVKIDGFRTGHIPEKILLSHIGEYTLLEEMAQRAIREHYPTLIMEHKIDAIGRPTIVITKLAMGNPLGIKITTAVMPEINLPEYKTIAQETNAKNKKEDPVIADAEVEEFIHNILKEKNKSENPKAPGDAQTGKDDTEPLPELTDELVKLFGDFKDVADFKQKIKEGLTEDKKRSQIEASRIALIDAIVDKTILTLPPVIIETEINKMVGEFKHDISRLGMTFEEYLKTIDKTEDDLREKMRPDAEKRAKTQLILNEIALAEKLVPTQEEINHEVEHLMTHYKDADRETAAIYVTTLLTNQKVLSFLEQQ